MKTRTTKKIISGKDTYSQIPTELSVFWPKGTALIICDANTWTAAGLQISRILTASNYRLCPSFVFSGTDRLHADTERIAELVEYFDSLDLPDSLVPISVGSGTLNDIVKRASFERNLQYMCVPTAPSVDGFTSFGAAITVNGFKTTLPCDAPLVVVADQDVMANAPYELLAAGYGDLAAKLVSGRDWLIAKALGFESIEPSVWSLSQDALMHRLSTPDLLAQRDSNAVCAVFDGLCDTGLAMQDHGDSRPASGAEHHISHCLEMRGLQVNGVDVLHGEKVACGTLLSAFFAESLFSLEKKEVSRLVTITNEISPEIRAEEVRHIYAHTGISSFAVNEAVQVAQSKLLFGNKRKEHLQKIYERWDDLRIAAFKNRPDYATLVDMFKRAGCPDFKTLGITKELAGWAIQAAQTIRNRYTILDLAYDLGVLSAITDMVISECIEPLSKVGYF